MTATQTQQTQQELNDILVKFEQEARRTGLAETDHNQRLLSEFLKKKYGGFINSASLADAVASLKSQLQWLAQPEAPKPTPAKPTGNRLWNELVNSGVSPTRHQSVNDQQSESKKVADRQETFLTRAKLLNEQSKLLEEQRDAEYGNLVMHRLGIDHYRTGEKRKAAKAKLLPKLEDFNKRCVNSGNNNLVIPV